MWERSRAWLVGPNERSSALIIRNEPLRILCPAKSRRAWLEASGLSFRDSQAMSMDYGEQRIRCIPLPLSSSRAGSNHSLNLFAFGSLILSIILALNFPLYSFHLLCLSVPLLRRHLGLFLEKFRIWLPVTTSQSIPQRSVLAIVVVKV